MSKYTLWIVAAVMMAAPAIVLAQTAPSDAQPTGEADKAVKSPADEGKTPTTTATTKEQQRPKGLLDGDYTFLIVLAVAFLAMMIFSSRSRKKQEAKRRALLNSLKKGDKITTIGGIVGTVIEVRENEVTVKTDETNNVRMKFARWAIRDIGEPAKGDVEPEKK